MICTLDCPLGRAVLVVSCVGLNDAEAAVRRVLHVGADTLQLAVGDDAAEPVQAPVGSA